MNTLISGLIIFFAIHLLPSASSIHASLKNRLGAMPFKGLFDMVSANRRGARPTGEALAMKTDAIVLVVSALVSVALMFFHESIAGMPIMG